MPSNRSIFEPQGSTGGAGLPSPAKSLAPSLALFALGLALAVHGLARSNRPHELVQAPYVALIFAGSSAFAVRTLVALVSLFRGANTRPFSLYLLLSCLAVFSAVNIILLAGAIKTAFIVLMA